MAREVADFIDDLVSGAFVAVAIISILTAIAYAAITLLMTFTVF